MQPVAKSSLPRGHYPLSKVMAALTKQASSLLDRTWAKFEDQTASDWALPRSSWLGPREVSRWAGPPRDAIAAGISYFVFHAVVLDDGKLFVSSNGTLVELGDLTPLLFFDCEFSHVPTGISDAKGLMSFAEHNPKTSSLPFLDAENWEVRKEAELGFAASTDEEEVLGHAWSRLERFAGWKLVYASNCSYKDDRPITPSQIAQRFVATMDEVASGKLPRKTSRLFQTKVDEIVRNRHLLRAGNYPPGLRWLAKELKKHVDPQSQSEDDDTPFHPEDDDTPFHSAIRTYRDALRERTWQKKKELRWPSQND